MGGHLFTERKQKLFLEALSKTGVVLRACESAKVSHEEVYRTKREDAEFARAWEEADDFFTQRLEAKAHSLAFEGKETSLWNLLRARRPEKYKEVLHNKHGGDDTPIKSERRIIIQTEGPLPAGPVLDE